jgi:hypothetical protein
LPPPVGPTAPLRASGLHATALSVIMLQCGIEPVSRSGVDSQSLRRVFTAPAVPEGPNPDSSARDWRRNRQRPSALR